MQLVSILNQYHAAFSEKYAARLLPRQHHALDAMNHCRTERYGEMVLDCTACHHRQRQAHSCGHRSCPQCQNYAASQWLDRQQSKLLPVEYFMATFTLPYELRTLAWRYQSTVYNALFTCVASTLKDFGMNPKHLGANIGMTAVLHTHTRQLDYHPHVHVVVPGGGINPARKQWIKKKGKYLFNAFSLAKVFRARFLATLNQAGLALPKNLPKQWVVDCTPVGKGKPALKYLSRYLYRGVLSEKNIVANHNGQVTFQYIESKTGKTQTRTLKGEDFCWLILQHILPKGFRRVRDYGFLHGNAKKRLKLVQLILHVIIDADPLRPRPAFKCPKCQAPMQIVAFLRPPWASG